MPGHNRIIWTKDMTAELIAGRSAAAPVIAHAKKIGVSPGAYYTRLRELGMFIGPARRPYQRRRAQQAA